MSALPTSSPATPRRSLFPERITAGRSATADRLRRHADRLGALGPLLATIEAVDAALPADAPPFASNVRHLARLAAQYVERARLARALAALADLHGACDVPGPLFVVSSPRHVAVLLATDPAAAEAQTPLGAALGWTRASGMPRARAVCEMASLLERLGTGLPFPLPAAVARNLPRLTSPPPAAEARPFEAWTHAVDAEASRFSLSGAVAHFTTLPWREAFDAGLAPERAAAVVLAYVVGCAVHGVRPFAWRPPPFEPRPERRAPDSPDADDAGDEPPVEPPPEAPDRGGEYAPACPRTADRLDAGADRLDAAIHHKRHLHADQTLTPRRARTRAAGQREADALEPVRDALRALATAARSGTLPAVLAGVTTRADAEELVATTPGTVPVFPDLDNNLHHRERRKRLIRVGIRDADDFDAAVAALAALARPRDDRPTADREAARIRSLVETARLSGIPDYFFSPPNVTGVLLDAAALPHDPGPAFRILDPSAGDGAILDAVRAAAPRAALGAVEINVRLREILGAKGYTLAGTDALKLADADGFDRIVMNPPFGRGGALAMLHVRHAYGLLRPGGRLVAVVPESCFFRRNHAHRDFRAWTDGLGGFDRSLPYEAFAPAGTSVSARVLVLDRPPTDGSHP